MKKHNCGIFPHPKNYKKTSGSLTLPENFIVLFENTPDGETFGIISKFKSNLKNRAGFDCYPVADFRGKLNVSVEFRRTASLSGESYRISIAPSGILVSYGEPVAAFRAQESLVQLICTSGSKLECCEIEDTADVARRGFMLDISRAKVPTLEKLFSLVDYMAMMKMNELQLYIEQFVYEYQEYPSYAHEVDALTPFEMMRLEKYAHENYIDLVPNQNSFGHLGSWLSKKEFASIRGGAGSLDPINPDSIKFVRGLHDSLLPCFHSDFVHIGCDEVSGLDSGSAKEKAEKIGAVGVYADFINEVNEIIHSHGRRAMFWGDVVLENTRNPELISRIDKDMIPIIWRYGDQKEFEERAEVLSPIGYDFYLCPSTNCWTNMFSNLNVAEKNMLDAAETAVKYKDKGALGVLIAEWGDFCHLQFDFPTLLSLSYGAGVTWSLEANRDIDFACDFADRHIYRLPDAEVKVSELVRRGADVYDAYLYSIAYPLDDFSFFTDPRYPADRSRYEKMYQTMTDIVKDTENLPEIDSETKLLKEEMICSAEISKLFTEILLLRMECRDTGEISDYETRLDEMISRTAELKKQVISLWNKRNKPAGNDKAMWFINFKLESYKKALNEKAEKESESK